MRLKRNTIIILCVIYICNVSYLTGCNKDKKNIKIGILGTMSGINSDLSVSGRRGAELAIEEYNKASGLGEEKVELVVKDDKNDPIISLRAQKEFIAENIPVVVGPYTSGMIVDSMSYLKDKNILFLSPTVSSDALTGIDDNFIRFIASTSGQALLLNNMANKNKDKKFAVLYDLENKGFTDALYNNFKKLLERNKGEIVLTKTFSSSLNVNYSSLAKEVLDSKANALFIIGDSKTNAEITQQIRKLGTNIHIYSPLWSNTADLIRKGGNAIEDMFIVGGIDFSDKSMNFVKFRNAYVDKYGENPTFSSVYSYETVEALLLAIKMGPDLMPSTLKNNIIKIKKFQGLQGNYSIDKFGDNNRKYMIFKIESGQLKKGD
ncbi:ABC transporter substrate-binding protein [Clostridium tagluense]|uniref:ABC transporter substrate-binding protein n=1 Tax=Clostridium tagluense TaxID=360422 RepID=A0A401UKR5_9CLOT|nr:ABC transporter substrate-binding protein [Clostridium tagluense]GCD10095.1 ABC transporter substrate-binding protein [Clostridium tagluense]